MSADNALKLLMFCAVGTPDGKPRLLTFPPGEAPQYDRSVSTHEAIRSAEGFPGDWQLDLMLVSGIKRQRGIVGRIRLLGAQLRVARLALWACRKYDVLICGQVSELSVCLGLFQQLVFWRRVALILREFMLGANTAGTPTWLRTMLIKLIYRKVNLAVCSSSRETQHYSRVLRWHPSRISFLHLTSLRPSLQASSVSAETFILSAGRTGRDYATLLSALEGLDVTVVLVCSPDNLKGMTPPPNVRVHYDIPRRDYESLLERCAFVVVPLLEANCSAGQRVLEAAMSSGKAVIATNTAGTEDYILDGQTGILVPPGDPRPLRDAIIELWQEADLRHQIGEEGKQYALAHFSDQAYAEGFISLLRKALEDQSGKSIEDRNR